MLVPAPSESEMEQSGAQVLEWVTSPSWEDVEGALSYRAFDLIPRMLGVCVCVTDGVPLEFPVVLWGDRAMLKCWLIL